MDPKPSVMVRKFLSGGPAWQPSPNYDYRAFRKSCFFFYGTLMDPEMLMKILKRREVPEIVPAKLIGYKCMLWGQYPALVGGFPGAIVHGIACEIHSQEEIDRLSCYETDNYRIAACIVRFEDGSGKELDGRVFKWDRDISELKEGVFDLKDWQMRRMEENLGLAG